MPIYSVQLAINVPSVGAASPVFTNITATDIDDAIKKATAMVMIEPLAAQKTGA